MPKDVKAGKPVKTTPPGIRQPGKKPDLFPVEALAEKQGLPSWEAAALMTAAEWAPGKQVAEAMFQAALTRFRNRPQGGGRI